MSIVGFMYKMAQGDGMFSPHPAEGLSEKAVSRLISKNIFGKAKPWSFSTAQHYFLSHPVTAERFLKLYLTQAKARGIDPYAEELRSYYKKLPSSSEWEPARKAFQEYFMWGSPSRVKAIVKSTANTAIMNKSIKPALTVSPRWRLPLILGGLMASGLGAGYYFGREQK